MTITRPGRLVSALALVAAIGLGAAVSRSAVTALPPGTPPSGTLHLNPGTGDSATQFALVFDQLDSYCDGDGVAGYRWHTFITSITNDPATITFPGTGTPVSGGGVTLPLRLVSGVIVRAQTPTTVNGTEGFINLPLNFNLSSGAYGALTPGDYWVGVACTAESALGENVEYWSTAITISASTGAGPNNFTFAPAAPPATTTTTTTTTTTLVGATTTTTTTPPGATTTSTTVADGATTTSTTAAAGSSTTSSTTVAGAVSSTTTTLPSVAAPVVGGGSTGGPTGGGFGSGAGPQPQLAATGSSSWQLVIWAVLLLVFGRMAILLGRSPKVIDERR